MSSFMVKQVAFCKVSILAALKTTYIRFNTSVYSSVSIQVTFFHKSLIAVLIVTIIVFYLSFMISLEMDFKSKTPSEFLTAFALIQSLSTILFPPSFPPSHLSLFISIHFIQSSDAHHTHTFISWMLLVHGLECFYTLQLVKKYQKLTFQEEGISFQPVDVFCKGRGYYSITLLSQLIFGFLILLSSIPRIILIYHKNFCKFIT